MGTMIGVSLPDVDAWSPRVVVALGQNPGLFTGPGTNTYLVGTGRSRLLLDTGSGRDAYLPVLERALEHAGCEGIESIVLTHGHPDHVGGVEQVRRRFGPLPVAKLPLSGERLAGEGGVRVLADGDVVETEGATLRALHTPGHAEDHLCFLLEEERALFSGDNVLGVGTTVIPSAGGSLSDYLASLERLHATGPETIYPGHGPRIADGRGRIAEYIAHRLERERQILGALEAGEAPVADVVTRVYTDVPAVLHAAAGHSVAAHLVKLEEEGRVRRTTDAVPLEAVWSLP